MKKIVRLTALLLCLCLLVPPLAGCGAVQHPLRYLKSAAERTLSNGWTGRVAEVLEDSLKKGAVSFSYHGLDAESGLTAADVTLYSDRKNAALALDGQVTLGEKTYDAKAYLNEDALAFYSAALFGSGTFGVTFADLAQNINSSIFRNNSGTPYARPEVDGATAGEIQSLAENFFALYVGSEEAAKLAEDAFSVFLDTLEAHVNTVYYRQNGRVTLHITADNGALSATLRETRQKLVKDRKFCRRLRELARHYDGLLSAANGVVSAKTAEQVEYFLTNDAKTEELCARIDMAPAFELAADATVKSFSRMMEKLTLSFGNGEGVTYSFFVDLSVKNEFHMGLTTPEDHREVAVRNIQNSRKTASADFTFLANETLIEGAFSLDKKQKTYTLSFTNGEESRVLCGGLSLTRKGLAISVDRVLKGETELPFAFSLEIRSDVKQPAMPEYTEFFAMDATRYSYVDGILTPALEQWKQDMEVYAPTKDGLLQAFANALGLGQVLPPPPVCTPD